MILLSSIPSPFSLTTFYTKALGDTLAVAGSASMFLDLSKRVVLVIQSPQPDNITDQMLMSIDLLAAVSYTPELVVFRKAHSEEAGMDRSQMASLSFQGPLPVLTVIVA